MNRIQTTIIAALIAAAQVAVAQGVDRHVDATGGTPYATIEAAMVASSPGDRILVHPGSYPAFQFSRGVHVIGLGTDPSQVVVERVAFHVSIPVAHYDALLANLTIAPTNPINVLALSGNELAPGTFVVDGVVTNGGVFLRGGEDGFYLLVNNSRIAPQAGYGFSGEAAWLGGPGNLVEIRNSKILGWHQTNGIAAGHALRVAGGTQARLTTSWIEGGAATSGVGGSGVVHAAPGLIDITIENGTTVIGGTSATAAGGNGVAVPGAVVESQSTVTGGAGQPAGVPYLLAAPATVGPQLGLAVQPMLANAEGDIAVTSGQLLSIGAQNAAAATALLFSFEIRLPEGGVPIALAPESTAVVFGSTWSGIIPDWPGGHDGLWLYAQAVSWSALEGWTFSNTATIRLDLQSSN